MPTSHEIGLMVSSLSLGGIAGLLPSSWILDMFGRRYIVMLGDIIIIFAGMIVLSP
jgi:MFS family permease